MKLEGKAIQHVKFGKGIVKEQKEQYITIIFSNGEKKFIFPEAFLEFLQLKDQTSQGKIDQMLEGIKSEENKRKEEELKEEKFLEKLKNLKINLNSQAALGMIENSKEEVFSSWTAFSGAYLSGPSKGNPKPPVKLKLNSACLITECFDNEPEEHRKIIGAFMVSDRFEGKDCVDGIIKGHDSHRIELEEGETLLFWDYCSKGENAKWGKTELKYISNVEMQHILNEMRKVITDEKRQQVITDFYQYFCYVNNLNDL